MARYLKLLLVLAIVLLAVSGVTANAGPLPGAIFTTIENGSRVNANIYDAKEDVYLDGGPGPNAPSTAAGLPEGDYYFQVTDPSGKVLLSEDPVKCRKFHVNSFGVIDQVYPATCLKKINGHWVEVDCTHKTGVDQDHPELGAITIQLMPYSNTPNKGGVYKVWVTPVDNFVGDPDKVDNPQYFHGFVPGWSKTDNFKVKGKFVPPTIKIRKFDDSNANGVWDPDEEEIPGWEMTVTDPLGVDNTYYTPVELIAVPSGNWSITEATPDQWLQTALYLDGVKLTTSPTVVVPVAGTSGEIHEVVFGNIRLGRIEGLKFYDRNGNGVRDSGEPPVPEIRFTLTGTNVRGEPVNLSGTTGSNGKVVFSDLLPGNYVLTEVLPTTCGWFPTTPSSVPVGLGEGETLTEEFGNACKGYAAFNTKGYWHNVNGTGEITQADIDYVNSLAPYSAPTSYWETPFDGVWTPSGNTYFGTGARGEISDYLVNSVSVDPERFQLSQQLLAFIFNVRHRLDGDATIQLPDGSWMTSSSLISQAVSVWQSGSTADRTAMIELLDSLNNSSSVPYIHYNPCPVIY